MNKIEITVIDGKDDEMTIDEIITGVRDFYENCNGQVDLTMNKNHAVLSFIHYDMPDGDTHWVMNRKDFQPSYQKQLTLATLGK